MASFKRDYLIFYLQGRQDVLDEGIDVEVDMQPLADRVMAGESVNDVALEAAKQLLAPLALKDKTEVLADLDEQVVDLGGDKDLAWKNFSAGRLDETKVILEEQIIEIMWEDLGGEDPEDDEDDEDENDAEEAK